MDISCSYDSSDDLISPFNNEQLLLDDQEDEICNIVDYKLMAGGEGKGKSKYRQICESKSDTTVFSSSKSPLKMVFKKTSTSMTTVSPSVTPEPAAFANVTKSSRREPYVNEPEKPTETFTSPSQVLPY